MTPAQQQLVSAAKQAERWFYHHLKGDALNGPSDDIFVARELTAAIAAVEDEQAQGGEDLAIAQAMDRR